MAFMSTLSQRTEGPSRRSGRVAQRRVERNRCPHQAGNGRSFQRCALHEFEGCHFELSTWLQPRLDAEEALAPPEPEQHTIVLRANEKDGAAGEVDQMAPLDGFVH